MKEKEVFYTMKGLLSHLSNKYKVKDSGKQFNNSDVEQYVRYGFLPKRYGGQNIVEVSNKVNGCKTYKLEGNHFINKD